MSTFQKLSNGKVIFKDSHNVSHGFIPNLFVLPHPSIDNFIALSDDANPQEIENQFMFDFRNITVPAGCTTRDEMIELLCNDYFYDLASEGLDSVSAQIIAGKEFNITDFVTLSSLGSVKFLFTCGAEEVNLRFFFQSSTEVELVAYRNPAVTAGTGAVVTPLNSNDNSDNITPVAVVANPSVTNNGTRMFGISSGRAGWAGNPDATGFSEPYDFIILRPNTSYLFIFTNKDSTTNKLTYSAAWI